MLTMAKISQKTSGGDVVLLCYLTGVLIVWFLSVHREFLGRFLDVSIAVRIEMIQLVKTSKITWNTS